MPRKIVWHMDEFERIRKVAPLEAMFRKNGEEWVGRLNAELRQAQARRGQPVEDGYKYHITRDGSRIRMYVVAFTARAQAHEAEHQSILKLMHTTGWDVADRKALKRRQAARKAAQTRAIKRERWSRRPHWTAEEAVALDESVLHSQRVYLFELQERKRG